jgi:hypothetical protein
VAFITAPYAPTTFLKLKIDNKMRNQFKTQKLSPNQVFYHPRHILQKKELKEYKKQIPPKL